MPMHRLLKRQLKRHLPNSDKIPEELLSFVQAVNEAYWQNDEDRNIVERALELSSQELNQANSEMRAVFQAMPDLFLRTNLSGKILDFKAGRHDDLYQPDATLIGQNIREIPFPEIREKFESAVQQIRVNRSTMQMECVLSVEGVEGWYEARLVPLHSDQIIIIIRNITDRKKVEAALVHAKEAAEEANRTKSNFLSTVSHELRTPLTSVLGFSKIIKKKLDETIFPQITNEERKIQKSMGQVTNNLDIILSEGERLTALINDVLDIAKMEAGRIEWQFQDVAVVELITRSVNSISSLVEQKNLAIEVNITQELPTITGDFNRLTQVVINLLSNAVKFTEQGMISCQAQLTDKTVEISVSDQGKGIAKVDQEAIFAPFKQVGDTLTDKPTGTGLGLPICKHIVEHHGGKLWVESELEVGSTFYFSIPLSRSKPTDRENPQIIAEKEAFTQQLRANLNSAGKSSDTESVILLVDDDPSIRNLLSQQLEHEGYRTETACDGIEAIEKVRELIPDLIILDVMMPNMNGFDVAAILKNDPITKDIPIMMLSILEEEERGYRVGIDRYLTKPIETEHLLNETSLLLSQKESHKKVLVVDDEESTLETLSNILETKGYQVVTQNQADFHQQATIEQPDVIISANPPKDQEDLSQLLTLKANLGEVYLIFLGDGQAAMTPLTTAPTQS